MREILSLTLFGIAFGILGALAVTRFAAALLYGLTPRDPLVLGISAAIMLAIAAIAGYLPANRASRVDPMVALRYE